MRSPILDHLLQDERVKEILRRSGELYWKSQIDPEDAIAKEDMQMVCRTAFVLSNASLISQISDLDYADESYVLLSSYPISSEESLDTFENIAGYGFKDKSILYYFYVASLALKLNKTISARIVLKQYDAEKQFEETDWGQRTLYMIIKALLLLIRKQKGMADIRAALGIIEGLRAEQKQFEEKYIAAQPIHQQQQSALTLVGIYHMSKAVYDTADYLINGYNQQQRRITSSIRQHTDIALRLIDRSSRLHDFFTVIWNDLQLLVKNSIWSHSGFHNDIRTLCKFKAENELLELLPSQQEALARNMLNVAANAIVLQMPTSAGKTLMAEFNMLVTRSLKPDAKIVYVVPSRALMNQVYFDMRDDLRSLDISIERTSSAVEVDPTENSFLLSEKIDILVCTPEKLDLLIRRDHPSVEDVAMFIIDEAHTIENGERGARLELLMTMLRRERPDAKFMLLSPFLPDGGEAMKEWLGGGNAIQIDWRPSEKLVFGLHVTQKKAKYTVLPTPFTTRIKEEQSFETDKRVPCTTSGKAEILEYAVKKFGEEGRTQLILCKGRKTANVQAKQIASWIDAPATVSDDLALVKKYIDEEIGCETLYTQLLSKGVTVHHAGLSDETKILIEHLIRQRDIRYVCATTTIAEGVNFPVSSVYFDTYTRGKNKTLSTNDFWNIAGRAGRTLVDDFGKIILPFNSKENKKTARDLISKGAEQLSSVLARLFVNREEVIALLSEDHAVRRLSYAFPDSFGPLFQYFIHLLNVAENDYVADVEDLFKDTLAYTLMDDWDKDVFIDLCKRIYLSIQSEYSGKRGALKFADKTGFSVPSVLSIMQEKSTNPEIANLDSWQPNYMFDINNVDSLAAKLKVISELRETQLGSESDKAPLNTVLISQILVNWVKGEKLNNLSTIHPFYAQKTDTDIRVAEFVQYMTGMRFKASWGLSALEGIVRGNEEDMKDSYIPSYVYYGVNDPKSLAMRMLGVPRSLSGSLSKVIEGNVNDYSFTRLRTILRDLNNSDWDSLCPQGSRLSGQEWKRVVDILMK